MHASAKLALPKLIKDVAANAAHGFAPFKKTAHAGGHLLPEVIFFEWVQCHPLSLTKLSTGIKWASGPTAIVESYPAVTSWGANDANAVGRLLCRFQSPRNDCRDEERLAIFCGSFRARGLSMKNFAFLWFILIFCLVTKLGMAEPLVGNVEPGTSVSHTHGSQNLWTNPAAIGFDSELNGSRLILSESFGFSRVQSHDFAVTLGYGLVSLGLEEIQFAPGKRQRFGFALGLPSFPLWPSLPPMVYLGLRYVLVRSDVATLGSYDSVGLGLQIRPSKLWSVGIFANDLNRPQLAGAVLPVQFVFGATLRPLPWVTLMADVDTTSTNFLQTLSYQANAQAEVIPGLFVRAGYHEQFKWNAGIQLRLANIKLASSFQPDAAAPRSVTVQVEANTQPYASSVVDPPTALRLKVDNQIDEMGYRGGLFLKDRQSLLDVIQQLEMAEKQTRVDAVVIRLESFALGLGAAEELFEAIWKVRQAGKKVEVFLGNAGIKEYLIASAGTTVHMESAGELKILGLKSQRYFLKGTLEKLGVEGQFLAKGEYKSAPEMFTRRESSDSSRRATLEQIEATETEIQRLLMKSRRIDATKWQSIVEQGIFGAEDAKANGLVDAVSGWQKEGEKIRKSYVMIDDLFMESDRLALPPRVSVIVADGDILRKKSRLLSLGGESHITPDSVERQFRRAMSDRRTRAIVLRVSSPGGEILPSDEIAAMVERAKKDKLVVISMGDVAASGGYMISAPADRIFADNLTQTGSIGVFLGKFNLGGLFKKIELRKEFLGGGPFAAIDSEDRAWSDQERKLLSRRVDQYYDGFTSFVAKARKLSQIEVDKVAKGRVWIGRQALKHKLVDEIGGIHKAVQYAATQVGYAPGDFEVLSVAESPGLFDMFEGGGLIKMEKSDLTSELLLHVMGKESLRTLQWMSVLKDQPFLYWNPEL